MDDEFAKIEAELRQFRPVAPPPRVERGIAAALARNAHLPADAQAEVSRESRVRRIPRQLWWAGAASLPIAAAITVSILLFSSHRSTPAADPNSQLVDMLKPVAAKDVLYGAADEGLVKLDDGTPARRQRLRYVATVTWRDPKTHASLTWSVPREEVRVVPVRYQ